MNSQGLSFIVPVYNEENLLADAIGKLKSALSHIQIPHEIIVVNDGSDDNTLKTAQDINGIRIISHDFNRGYGSAIKSGIKHSRFEWVGIIDADGTYVVDRLPGLISEMQAGYDMVVGSREDMYAGDGLVRKILRRIFIFMLKLLISSDIADPNSGFRLFKRDMVSRFYNLLCGKFSFTTSLTIAAKGEHLKIRYIPVAYSPRLGKSNIRYKRDLFYILYYIILNMAVFYPARLFLLLSICSFFSIYLPALAFINHDMAIVMPNALFLLIEVIILISLACFRFIFNVSKWKK